MKTSLLSVVLALGCVFGTSAASTETVVNFVRTPDAGIQPQAVADNQGVTHLVYFKGKPGAGDLFYTRLEPGTMMFGRAIPVNSQPGSAIAVGSIRGAQLALGRNGRVHVAWNGSKAVEGAAYKGVPLWYTRLNDAGTAFEPERDLITRAGGLDGGGSIAADNDGRVYAFWHGSAPDNTEGEAGRALFAALSSDDGKTFAAEKMVSPKAAGACGCCGMKAFADSGGNVFALYRGAGEKGHRDEILLVSRNHGAGFEKLFGHSWVESKCPMSSAFLSERKGGVLAAWETAGQVYYAGVSGQSLKVSEPVSPPGQGSRKHPVCIGNARGDVLLIWAEGTGWQRGGTLAWQSFSADGKPTDAKGRTAGAVPVWGLPAAAARGDEFLVIH